MVEIFHPEKKGVREREREESLNAGLGRTPSLLMTQRHVLGLEVGGIRVHNRFQSKKALMQPQFKHCLGPVSFLH